MRTASTPRPEQLLILPTQESWTLALQLPTGKDLVGKNLISKAEIKHVRFNYLSLQLLNN